jgi:hypothetical protein
MQVAQFFDAFAFRSHVEVVEALLPDVLWSVLKQSVVRGVALPFRLFQNSPRKTEFERLAGGARFSCDEKGSPRFRR